jgi:3-hydroxymyristoyl/3-hydroxydecanoyl-(acyl carrier protein) dehydratase
VRWRTIDRIDGFEPWKAISGTKAISFEEGALLERFGRESEYPTTLVIEACVELTRWLVAASSGFTATCLLGEVSKFRLDAPSGTGDRLGISVSVVERGDERLVAEARVERRGVAIGRGALTLELTSLDEHCDPGCEATLWKELYGAA